MVSNKAQVKCPRCGCLVWSLRGHVGSKRCLRLLAAKAQHDPVKEFQREKLAELEKKIDERWERKEAARRERERAEGKCKPSMGDVLKHLHLMGREYGETVELGLAVDAWQRAKREVGR